MSRNERGLAVDPTVMMQLAQGFTDAGVEPAGPTTVWVEQSHPLFELLLRVETVWAEGRPPELAHPGWPDRFEERYLVVVEPEAGVGPRVRSLLRIAWCNGLGSDGLFGLPILDQLMAGYPDEVTPEALLSLYHGQLGVEPQRWQSVDCLLRLLGPDGEAADGADLLVFLAYVEAVLEAEERTGRSFVVFADLNPRSLRSLRRAGVQCDPVLGSARRSVWCRWDDDRYVPYDFDDEYSPCAEPWTPALGAAFDRVRALRLPNVAL